MNDIVVGVKRIKNGSELAEPHEEASAAVGAMWITVDGKEIADGTDNLIGITVFTSSAPLVFRTVTPEEREEAFDEELGGPLRAEVQLICGSFKTVDFRDPEYAPERFRSK